MAIRNIAGDVEGHCKTSGEQPHDKKTHEANFVQIFGIEKQVRNAEVFAKVSGDHGEQNNPAQYEYMIAPDVIQQQLNRKRVIQIGNKQVEFSHTIGSSRY